MNTRYRKYPVFWWLPSFRAVLYGLRPRWIHVCETMTWPSHSHSCDAGWTPDLSFAIHRKCPCENSTLSLLFQIGDNCILMAYFSTRSSRLKVRLARFGADRLAETRSKKTSQGGGLLNTGYSRYRVPVTRYCALVQSFALCAPGARAHCICLHLLCNQQWKRTLFCEIKTQQSKTENSKTTNKTLFIVASNVHKRISLFHSCKCSERNIFAAESMSCSKRAQCMANKIKSVETNKKVWIFLFYSFGVNSQTAHGHGPCWQWLKVGEKETGKCATAHPFVNSQHNLYQCDGPYILVAERKKIAHGQTAIDHKQYAFTKNIALTNFQCFGATHSCLLNDRQTWIAFGLW